MMIKSRYTLLCAAAAVLGIAACDIDPEQAPPTSIDGSGTVTGQVYFDANGNGTFDPLGGDTALTSATVDLSARGDSAHVLKSTTTNTSGNFTFVGVPLGTHEVRARVAGNQIVTCVPVPVTVQVSAQAFASTPLRVSCRIDIVEAENSTSGSVVTVGGIVTAAPGVYRNNNGYIQDATGGIQIFAGAISTSSGIQEGDSIEATGVLAPFQNEMELSPTNTFRIVTRGRPGGLDPGAGASHDALFPGATGGRAVPAGQDAASGGAGRRPAR